MMAPRDAHAKYETNRTTGTGYTALRKFCRVARETNDVRFCASVCQFDYFYSDSNPLTNSRDTNFRTISIFISKNSKKFHNTRKIMLCRFPVERQKFPCSSDQKKLFFPNYRSKKYLSCQVDRSSRSDHHASNPIAIRS
jgi:hypothetical protein